MIDLIKRVAAFLSGRELVWLIDFDGEVSLRAAKRTPFGLVCNRFGFGFARCLLLPGGRVQGPSFVKQWKPWKAR